MAIIAVSIAPLGMGPSVSDYVVAAEEILAAKPDLKWQIGPMFTTIEGDLDEVLGVVREMQEAVFEAGASRVVTTIQIDDRRDKLITIEGKLRTVEEKMGIRKS
ncbi:MAG TPA: MTH1187 family thiamine-binding protein [Desulfitobacteriaceae bacterium]|nr:MTH1187 family thiamine-binding protein [Desulfitobacteriaceae bacterium]